MKLYQKGMILILSVVMGLYLVSCEKKKIEGKVIITEQEFIVRQDNEHSYAIDARGKIRNVGDVDVKKVVVTGYCRSCNTLWVVGQWIITPEVEKMPEQKDIISYISVGNEEAFSFTNVADVYVKEGGMPPEMPEKLEVVIESFETVEE